MKKIRSTNHKITAALLVAVMMLSVIFTAVFSGGMKAKAGSVKYIYNFSDNTEEYTTYNPNNFFNIGTKPADKSVTATINEKKYNKGHKLNSGGIISFTAPDAGTLKILCANKSGTTSIKVNEEEKSVINTGCILEWSNIAKDKTVEIKRGEGEACVYVVIFETTGSTESSTSESTTSTTYTVNVVNGTVNGETLKSGLNNGESVTIEADKKDNFAYWLNSSNKIVSTDTSYTFNVYFSDTYTAVYNDTTSKKVVFMTVYGQEYDTKVYDDSFTMPKVPARYGYTNGVWEKNAEDIANEFEKTNAKVIEVSPKYTVSSTATYTVKIDDTTTIVGASETEMQEYKNGKDVPANTIITATTSKSGFTCWKDGKTDEVLSYNQTYSFYVNKDVSLAPKSDKTAVATGAIRVVNVVTNSDGNTEIIYEFTVPDGCKIKFAGIVADTNLNKVNDKDAKYKGGKESSTTTFRYTLTVHSSMVDKLYVKPILKYWDTNDALQIIGDDAEATLVNAIK